MSWVLVVSAANRSVDQLADFARANLSWARCPAGMTLKVAAEFQRYTL